MATFAWYRATARRVTIFPRQRPLAVPKFDRIPVVDDQKDVGEILEAFGASMVTMSSAAVGLEFGVSDSFDRAIVDLRMLEMSGVAFLEKFEDLRPALAARAILMTADTVRGLTTLLRGGTKVPVREKPFSFTNVHPVLAALSTK